MMIISKPISRRPTGAVDRNGAPDALAWLLVKLAYTAFCAVLIPVYLTHYGPTNFLYFCDEAVLLTLVGIWTGQALPVSMAAVGIIIPQIVWVVDFVATALGHPLLSMTAYMFDAHKPLFLRALSSFHGWLPFLLIYFVARMGYDRRAWLWWTVLASLTIAVAFFLMPPPSPDAGLTPVNIDYVWGLSDSVAQTWIQLYAWLGLLLFGLPLLASLPTHLVLSRFSSTARGGLRRREAVRS